ncbi:hypothetical protein E2C01_070944 [Portunus trituberculatus]|uniref:Uncharacterized protein n=1 Tax=Portunus trituberculatus TaxID=210409 RepID=A0A5B7I6P5_PORTR|nr:hypothetical protein [Portunus trituberculatus]
MCRAAPTPTRAPPAGEIHTSLIVKLPHFSSFPSLVSSAASWPSYLSVTAQMSTGANNADNTNQKYYHYVCDVHASGPPKAHWRTETGRR